MSPEQWARHFIDATLASAGWLIQDFRKINLSAGRGVAVREYPTGTGPADCVLVADHVAVGVIERIRAERAARMVGKGRGNRRKVAA